MDNFTILKRKLRGFIRRYYINELLRGLIFFIATGLLYLLITLFIEHIFWLEPFGRMVLFWSFVLVEFFLLGRFIVYPLLKLFRISKGIDDVKASIIIGRHFPEVKDKLLNVLQLRNSTGKTDLLLAGIDQKATELKPVPFSLAIDFRKNLPYLKYAAFPVLILLVIFAFGKAEIFSKSYKRVVNYKTAYEPPAPFSFRIDEQQLKVRENEPLILKVVTDGRSIPEEVSVQYGSERYFLTSISPGVFQYVFEPVQESFKFRLSGNEVISNPYLVEVVRVPRTLDLQMIMNFPDHTGLADKILEGTGNAIIPEGTEVRWDLKTTSTDLVQLKMGDSLTQLHSTENFFSISRTIRNSVDYEFSTSNQEVQNFENIAYSINVVKDAFPKLLLEHRQDSLEKEIHYFYGKVSDDYGIRRVNMVTLPVEGAGSSKTISLDVGKGAVGEFLAVFPDTLDLERGREYEMFFEVVDNDAVNGFKKIKSRSFFFRKKTREEEKDERLDEQNHAIRGIDGSLKELKESKTDWDEMQRLQKDKDLSFEQRKKIEGFLKRQKRQNQMMESFTERLKKSLEKEEKSYDENLRKEITERLEKREEELKDNEKVLEELEKYRTRLEEEGLREKLEEISKGINSQERNLEQLLELTKRYYVQEKLQQIADNLEKLGSVQEEMARAKNLSSYEEQDSLNRNTREVLEKLEELGRENKELKKPMELGRDEKTEDEIPKDQKNAAAELKEGKSERAKNAQKEAAEKLKDLSAKMKQQMQVGSMQQMAEDVDMLRQILDNLVVFSFGQEKVMEDFKKLGNNSPSFSAKLREQNFLKDNFKHIDDSIYSLALRNQMITEQVTNKLMDVEYNLEKSLERLAQNEVHLGIGSQQYVVTGANDLAYLLSKILGNMQQMLNQATGKGEGGSGQGMQLPDIIRKQKELSQDMQKGLEEDNHKGEDGKEEKGDQGYSEKESEELFRIFQEQQMLRMALEEKLKNAGDKVKDTSLQKEMEQIEEAILEKGFNRKTLQQMQRLEHKLLELEEAKLLQGKEEERESETSKEEFQNTVVDPVNRAKEYFETTEFLNRQSLPLRQIYRLKVKQYFGGGYH